MKNCAILPAGYFAIGFLLAGCGHSYLKSGGDLAVSLQKGDTALTQLSNSEADTNRVYRYTQLSSSKLGVAAESDLPSGFIQETCRPFNEDTMITERIALSNISKYQTFLATKATDPKDKSLAALISSFSSARSVFPPSDVAADTQEYTKTKKLAYAACAADVRKTFLASFPAGAPTVVAALAAWPKVKAFITLLLVEENEEARENAIIESLKNPETQKALNDSLSELERSATNGKLYKLSTNQKQLALWSAYADFQAIQEAIKASPTGISKIESFQKINDLATRMASSMKTYNELASIAPKEIVEKMQKSLVALQTAAVQGEAPDASWEAELISAIDFFSDASDKYAAASSALLGSK